MRLTTGPGQIGAYVSDLLLQTLGIAVFFIPLMVVRLGLSWMKSRAMGSTKTKMFGLALWLTFAPAGIALLPGHPLWKHTLPLSGVLGGMIGDTLVRFVNLPGAMVLCTLMVALSVYLTTTFMFTNASEWFASHFAFIRNTRERYAAWKDRRREKEADQVSYANETKRERATAKARSRAQKAVANSDTGAVRVRVNTSLLSSFLGWFGRRKNYDDLAADQHDRADFAAEPPSMWQTMPRTMVDEVPLSGLSAAAAAAAPYAAQLAAAGPRRCVQQMTNSSFRSPAAGPAAMPQRRTMAGWMRLNATRSKPAPSLSAFDILELPPARSGIRHGRNWCS